MQGDEVGGAKGTRLTDFGRDLLSRYREMEAAMLAAAQTAAFEWMVAAIRSPE